MEYNTLLKLYFPFSALFNLATSLAIGLFVISKNWKTKTNRVFFLLTFSIAFWSFGYFYWQLAENKQSALFWCRVLTAGSIWISQLLYYFVINFLGLKRKKYNIIAWIGFFTAFIFTVFNITTDLLIKSTRPVLIIPFWPIPGILYLPYLVIFLFYAIYTILLLWYGYKKGSAFRKEQIKWFFWGIAISWVGGCTNYPQWYGIDILPLGNILASAYPICFGYAIIRYRAFEIDTVIHKTLLWLLTSASVLVPIGILLRFIRPWLVSLGLLSLTLVVTALFYVFLYYFKTIQPRIDHAFRRRKYDYYAVLAEIPQRIGSELNTKSIIDRLFKELKEVLYLRNALILLQETDSKLESSDYTEAGSFGFEKAHNLERKESVKIIFSSNLSGWLNTRKKTLEREQIELDPQYSKIKPETLSFLKLNSLELLIPIIMKDKVNAILGIGKKENLQAFTLRDIELLEHIGTQIGITIDNALHHEDIVEKERLAEELRLGRDIQMALLPKELPQIANLSISGLMLPAKEIGGDYYDFIPIHSSPLHKRLPDNGHCEGEKRLKQSQEQDCFAPSGLAMTPAPDSLAIVIGDVSGKGVAAGLLMAMAKTAIHTLSQQAASPKELLLRTNQILYTHIGGQKFMTLLYLKWDSSLRTLTYSSAGHEHILIYRSNTDSVESIISGGFMLGMLQDIEAYLEEHTITLEPKDKILLYTDGVTEAENTTGERLGLDKLIELFKLNNKKPPEALIQAIKDEVYTFMGTQPQYDDITLVGMEAK